MSRRVELQGHRGARGLFPENTLEGFRGALALGVDVLEMDVGLTADDVVVVIHDPTLNPDIVRGPDGAWLAERGPPIRTLGRAALRGYDVGRLRPGSDYAAAFPDQRPCDGSRIPDLAAVLALDATVGFDIEMKTSPLHPERTASPEAMADATLAVVRAAGAVRRTVLQSFHWRGLRHVRGRLPEVALSWLTRRSTGAETRRWWDGPDPSDYAGSWPRAVAAEGGPIWAPEWGDLDASQVAEAHALGLRVIPWTVNRAEDMRRMLGFGVDGLITDRPDIARAVLAGLGHPLPLRRRPQI